MPTLKEAYEDSFEPAPEDNDEAAQKLADAIEAGADINMQGNLEVEELKVRGESDLGGDLKHTGSKMGFAGATPIVPPVVVVNPDPAVTVANLIVALQTLGLIA